MKKAVLTIIGSILLGMSGMSQLIPLYESEGGSILYLNPSRIFSYNLYEKSRWGAGLRYDIALAGKIFKTLSLSGYGAYGYEDERFKWGLKSDLLWNSKRQTHTYMEVIHDLTPDASRNLGSYQLTSFTATPLFMTRLFSDTWRLTAGVSERIMKRLTTSFEVRLSRERPLYDKYGHLLYPDDLQGGATTRHDFGELRLLVSHDWGWTSEIIFGSENPCGKKDPFIRLLSQVDHTFPLTPFDLHLFVQVGGVSPDSPYSRMFDLGGIWTSPLSLERALLTARVNEFGATIFGLSVIKLSLEKPVFRLVDEDLRIGFSPTPFLRVGAEWGALMDTYYAKSSYRPMAPDKGLMEVGAGVDGLIVWGAVEWGGIVAYRLAPSSAPYHYSAVKDNLALMLTAHLNL